MARVHVKKNDMVTVITGASKGRSGRVLSVNTAKQQVLVEGLNIRRKTVRRSAEHPQGGIIEMPAPLHASNVMKQEKYDERQKKQGKATVTAAETAESAEAEASAETQDEVAES